MTPPSDAGTAAVGVLLCAPVGRDAALTRDLLQQASIPNVVCQSMTELCDIFERQGGGALLLTEEALEGPAFSRLAALLDAQPSWSDVPVLVFAGGTRADMGLRSIDSIAALRNVTLLERPIGLAAVLSAVRSAVRARARQYEVRDLLAELSDARAAAEAANRLKDEFLAMLSHELRTPLNAIVGWTSMLTRGQVAPARMPWVFETLDRNAQSQARLIADVLDVSGIVTGKLHLQMTAVDVCDLVARATESVRASAGGRNLELSLEETRSCLVRGDPGRLQQVVWNLLSNAVKFTPAGGSVRVTVTRDDRHVVIVVADTGAGIPHDFLPLVFDRFRQADQTSTRPYGGLGLGLAIVKHLVDLHSGTVSASSGGPGQGACFTVRLPAEEPTEVPAAPAAQPIDVSLTGRTILLVDDDVSTRDVVSAGLEGAGADVSVVPSAADAWDALHRRLPDVLIADLAMPVEDGFSLIRRVRNDAAIGERLPAIALSAFADARSEAAALAAGFSAFIAKPTRPDALLRLIDDLLNAVRVRPAPPA